MDDQNSNETIVICDRRLRYIDESIALLFRQREEVLRLRLLAQERQNKDEAFDIFPRPYLP